MISTIGRGIPIIATPSKRCPGGSHSADRSVEHMVAELVNEQPPRRPEDPAALSDVIALRG